jgi:hypothetical protein
VSALAQWRREVAAGRRLDLHDDLWRAACIEQGALDHRLEEPEPPQALVKLTTKIEALIDLANRLEALAIDGPTLAIQVQATIDLMATFEALERLGYPVDEEI